MLKILNYSSKSIKYQFLSNKIFNSDLLKFKFSSSSSDPYYILGIQKGLQFKQIKKAFFKLANEYHPDKNDTIDARKKFIIIKQAFQQIKIQKGLMKPQNFVQSTNYDSVRPNPTQFNSDQEQNYKSNQDYRIFRQKANSDQRYSQFNQSFKTIHDINDIKIKVQEGKMKDSSERFNLNNLKAKITSRSQGSSTIVIIGMAGIFIILSVINQTFSDNQQVKQTQKVISTSQINKEKKIQNQKQKRLKYQQEKQKKIKHQQLMKILINNTPKNQQEKRYIQNQRNSWSKLVQKSDQGFLKTNQRAI